MGYAGAGSLGNSDTLMYIIKKPVIYDEPYRFNFFNQTDCTGAYLSSAISMKPIGSKSGCDVSS